MNKSKMLISASALALAVSAGSASAFEKGVSLSADGGNNHAWGSTLQVSGGLNSVSMSQYAVSNDKVLTVDYKRELIPLGSHVRMTVGLSGMKSDYSNSEFGETDYEAGYALGYNLGFGYDFVGTGTSIDVSLTEEISEVRFDGGKIFDAGLTQRLNKNLSVKAGFRQIDREVDGEADELLETGYLGLKFHF